MPRFKRAVLTFKRRGWKHRRSEWWPLVDSHFSDGDFLPNLTSFWNTPESDSQLDHDAVPCREWLGHLVQIAFSSFKFDLEKAREGRPSRVPV